jgi:phage shock protein A
VVPAKERLQLQEQSMQQQADKFDGQAREATSVGREDLARAALERKQLIVQETGLARSAGLRARVTAGQTDRG